MQTLDAAMLADKFKSEINTGDATDGDGHAQNDPTDVLSTVESYKQRKNSYVRNPLAPPKEIFVNIPQREKIAEQRTPLYRNNMDLIANGIGEG